MKVHRIEQHLINRNHKAYKDIDLLCWKSKNLYNYANYIVRQEFISNDKYLNYFAMRELCTKSEVYQDIGSNVGQETLRLLDKNWKSFFVSIKDWKQNPSKYLGRPKLPKYKDKEKGRYLIGLDSNKVKLKDGYIYFCWKPLKIFNNLFISKIPEGSRIIQCRFVPRGYNYAMEIVYQTEVPETPTESERIAAIDLGVNNFITMTNNIGLKPIVVKGGVIKSINQYFNKQYAKLKSELKVINNLNTSHRIERLCKKREQKLKYEMHLVSRRIIEYCINNKIDTLVCGLNQKWKQGSDMFKTANQQFVYIPYSIFIRMLTYKCENVGIKFVLTEETYTSGTSFLDGEIPCKENYDKSRRKYRGLFITGDGTEINADVNGSYQIMRKVFPNAFADGIEGVYLHPVAMNLARNGVKTV